MANKTATQKRRAKGVSLAKRNKVARAKGRPKGPPPAQLRRPRAKAATAPAPRDVGLLDALAECFEEIEALAGEMQDWADNMPESKHGGDKHSEVEECATTLSEFVDPVEHDTMSALNSLTISIQDLTPKRRGHSRNERLTQVRDVIGQVLSKLESIVPDDLGPAAKNAADDLHTDLNNIEGELDAVEFPGMFG